MKAKRIQFLALILIFIFFGIAQAGVITNWNTDTVVTDPGPYTEYVTYYSTIFTDLSLTTSYGAISWKETNVQGPGLKVVNDDDQNGTNCLMTTGYNPYDGTDKMCSDPLQSSKRFKLKNFINAPLDIHFDVVDGDTGPYRSFQKYTDVTDVRWSGFTIELGFMVGGQFVRSTSGDGLGFSDTRGRYFTNPITTYQSKENTFSAFYAQGLAGPADKYHPEPGYFNPFERMSFGMIGTEDVINSDGVSATYSNVFGEWLNSAGVPIAVFYDDDSDILTDNILMANCADPSNLGRVGPHSGDDIVGYTCDGQWVTFRSEPGLDSSGAAYESDGTPEPISLSDLAPVVYATIYEAIASGDQNPMYMATIEDAANLGLTFWIQVDDIDSWPTSSFTIRYTPIPAGGGGDPTPEVCDDLVDNDLDGKIDCADSDCADEPECDIPPPTSEICDDGSDNDGDGYIDCADPDCAGIGLCGTEGKTTTCSDGFDNDGDGTVDCDDSGCSKNRACR